MTGERKDLRWRELCEAILNEPNPARLHELISMLNDELEERENRRREVSSSHRAGN